MPFELTQKIPTNESSKSICYPFFSSGNSLFEIIPNTKKNNFKFLIELSHKILDIKKVNLHLLITTTERFYLISNRKIIKTLKISANRSFGFLRNNLLNIFMSQEKRTDWYVFADNSFKLISRVDGSFSKIKFLHDKIIYAENSKLKEYDLKNNAIKKLLYAKTEILDFEIEDDTFTILTEKEILKNKKNSEIFEYLNFNLQEVKDIKRIKTDLYSFVFKNALIFQKWNEATKTFEEILTESFEYEILEVEFLSNQMVYILFENKISLFDQKLNEIYALTLPKINSFDILNNQIAISSAENFCLYENNAQILSIEMQNLIKIFMQHNILILVSPFCINLYDLKNHNFFREFQIEEFDEIINHKDILILSKNNFVFIYDLFGKQIMQFKISELSKIIKIVCEEDFLFILTYEDLIKYDLRTSTQFSLKINALNFDLNDKKIFLVKEKEVAVYSFDFEYENSFSYFLEGRRRDEKFLNKKTANSIKNYKNLNFISGDSNQLKVYFQKYELIDLKISLNRDLEGFKKILGNEKSSDEKVLKEDLIKCVDMKINKKTDEVILLTLHELRIYAHNKNKLSMNLSEDLSTKDVEVLLKENKIQKAMIVSLLLNSDDFMQKSFNFFKKLSTIEIEMFIKSLEETLFERFEGFLFNFFLKEENFDFKFLIILKEIVKRSLNKEKVTMIYKKLREVLLVKKLNDIKRVKLT